MKSSNFCKNYRVDLMIDGRQSDILYHSTVESVLSDVKFALKNGINIDPLNLNKVQIVISVVTGKEKS